MAGWFPLFAPQFGAQINVDGYMIGDAATGGGAFLNAFKTFGYAVNPDPSLLDDLGYPKTSLASDIPGSIRIPAQMQGPSEQWVLKVTGTRQMRIFLDLSLVFVSETGLASHTGGTSSNMTVSFTGVGRVVFTFASTGNISTYFKSGGTFATGTGEVVLCRLSDEAAVDAGQYWTPEYLAFMVAGHHRTIRTMPWTMTGASNLSNEVKWNYRVTTAHVGWICYRFPSSVWGGTAGGTNTYTASAATDTPGSITHQEIIQLRFTNANTSTTPTLNVGSRGAKTIVSRTADALQVGEILAGEIATLVYDDLLDKYIYFAGGINYQIPIEAQVDLANRLAVNLWRCYPLLVDDTYVTTDTTYIRDNLNASRVAYHEYGNEVWNFAFPTTGLAYNKGLALGFPDANNQQFDGYYALRFRQVMGIVTTLWSGRSNFKRVLGHAAHYNMSTTNLNRFLGTDLSTSLGYTRYNSYVGVSYNSAPNRPIDYADVLSYASYYSGANFMNFDGNYTSASAAVLNAAATNYTADLPAALAWLDNDIRQGTRSGSPGGETMATLNTDIYPGWNAYAVTYNKPYELYEGAMECNAPSSGTCTSIGVALLGSAADASAALAALLVAYKNSAYAGPLLTDQFNQFMAQSKSVAPSQFVLLGPSQWALFPEDMFSTPYTSYTALKRYNGG